MKLGVNVDHIATLRQQRRGKEPDPVTAAGICELAGASSIICHLREDRRHIQERDLRLLREVVKTRLNLEMALCPEIVKIALDVKPDEITLVPEKREELTTEGGLDVVANLEGLKKVVKIFKDKGILVSLFVDAENDQLEASKETGAPFVELHTGKYANALGESGIKRELERLKKGKEFALSLGLRVNAGHGLDYQNVKDVASIPKIENLNIGYSIIGRAVFIGLYPAVKEMLSLIE